CVGRGVLVKTAVTRGGQAQCASGQRQTDRAHRQAVQAQFFNSVHHAVCATSATAVFATSVTDSGACLRNSRRQGIADQRPETLITGEEKELVLLDRPACYSSELLQFRGQFIAHSGQVAVAQAFSADQTGIEMIARVQGVAAAKCICRSVKLVGPGFYADINHRARLPAPLALGFSSVLNSWMASTGSIVA